ncbi:MAG: hypothetical protein ABID38_04445 [Candidatus Diapherotrites archaeon]
MVDVVTSQLILTGALVLITGYYAWANKQMLNEMRKTRELENDPSIKIHLVAELDFNRDTQEFEPGPPFYTEIINIGKGPAYDLSIIATDMATDESIHEKHDILKPGDTLSPFFREQVIHWKTKVFEKDYSIIVKYENTLGQKKEIEKRFDKKSGPVPHYSKTPKRPLEDIVDVLRDIRDSLEKNT